VTRRPSQLLGRGLAVHTLLLHASSTVHASSAAVHRRLRGGVHDGFLFHLGGRHDLHRRRRSPRIRIARGGLTRRQRRLKVAGELIERIHVVDAFLSRLSSKMEFSSRPSIFTTDTPTTDWLQYAFTEANAILTAVIQLKVASSTDPVALLPV